MRFLPALILPLLLLAAAPARADGTEADPWEGFNRKVFAFNDAVDRGFLKPLAKGYQAVTPDFVDTGVSNVFANLGEVPSFVAHLLQGDLSSAGADGGRFAVNSTLGLLGLFDVASRMGLEQKNSDLGLAFGSWGVGPGPYLVLPFLGPSTVRDAIGRGGETVLHPLFHVDEERLRWSLRALDIVDLRADLLEAEDLITGDRYTFLRNLYLQRRQFLQGGVPEPSFEDDFGDEDF